MVVLRRREQLGGVTDLASGCGHASGVHLRLRERGLQRLARLHALHVGSLGRAHRPLPLVGHGHAELADLLLARVALEVLLVLHLDHLHVAWGADFLIA